MPRKPYILTLGPSTDPLLAETVRLLEAQYPAIETHCVSNPSAVHISVYTDWRHGWEVIDDPSLRVPRRLDDALAVLALRIFPHGPDDDRFDFADNRYRRGEIYAAWLALLSDPAIPVLNRPTNAWPPADGLSRSHIRAIARTHGVATIREVIQAHIPEEASWRLDIRDGALHRLPADTTLPDPAPPSSYLYLDSPWRSLVVSRVADQILLDEPSEGSVSDLDRGRIIIESQQIFSALKVDVGHAIFLRERGRFAFSSLSLTTPSSCSRLHIQNLAGALVQVLVTGTMAGQRAEVER